MQFLITVIRNLLHMRSEGARCCVLSSPFNVCLDWMAAQSVGCRCYCRFRFASLLSLCLYRTFRAHSFVLVKETSNPVTKCVVLRESSCAEINYS